jgi:hypothetical protein
MIWDFDPVIGCLKDWRNKYADTTVLVDGVPTSIIDIDETRTSLLSFESKEITVVSHDEAVNITPFLPDSQWVDFGGLLIYLQRYPSRQWHRSFHRNSYSIKFPYDKRVSPRDRLVGRLDFAAAILGQVDSTLGGAVELLTRDPTKYGVVLNKNFAVVLYSDEVMQLCGPAGIVGFINPATMSALVCSHVFQEVLDLLRGEPEWRIIKSTSI